MSSQLLPSGVAVDELANNIAKLKKKGVLEPFVCVKMETFLPPWAMEQSSEIEESDANGKDRWNRQIAEAMNSAPEKVKRTMGIVEWIAAFDRYALAAEVTCQMRFASALAHKNVCLRIAANAKSKSRSQ